jgi:hypothetical protein
MKNYKRTFASLIDAYVDNQEQYNYGGFVPARVFFEPTPPPSPSVTPTNTQTPTNTNTPTPTGTQTPTPTQTGTQTPTPTTTSTPTPTASPPAFDVDAAAYLNQVLLSGGTGVTSTVSGATNTLFTDLKSAGLYSKIQVLYPFVGGVANSHRINGKNLSQFNLTFFNTVTHSANGVTGGANARGDTAWIQSGNTTTGNTHLSTYIVFSGSGSLAGGWDIGRQTSPGDISLAMNANGLGGALFLGRIGTINVDLGSNQYQPGFYAISRTGTTQIQAIKFSGNTYSRNSNEVRTIGSAIELFNLAGSGVHSNKTYGTYTIGTGLTGSEMETLRSIIVAFNNALGR